MDVSRAADTSTTPLPPRYCSVFTPKSGFCFVFYHPSFFLFVSQTQQRQTPPPPPSSNQSDQTPRRLLLLLPPCCDQSAARQQGAKAMPAPPTPTQTRTSTLQVLFCEYLRRTLGKFPGCYLRVKILSSFTDHHVIINLYE